MNSPMGHTYVEYKQIVHLTASAVMHARGKYLIDMLNEEGHNGWVACGMFRSGVDRTQTTIVYLYRINTIQVAGIDLEEVPSC